VEREQRSLDGKGEREYEEKAELDRGSGRDGRKRREVECLLAGGDVLANDSDQHQQRARQRVEHELHRCPPRLLLVFAEEP